jgi:serine O-acetyltransferase
MANGVTIGQANRGSLKGTPVIGDDVWVGANAVIVGNIKIGNDVLIAPGAFVNFDVPDHSVVIGNPGQIRKHKHATKGYINRRIEFNDEKGKVEFIEDKKIVTPVITPAKKEKIF